MRYLNARNTAFGEDRKIYSTVDSTATAGQTVFNVAYDQGRVAVFLNGIRLVPVQDYTYTLSGIGSNITLGAGITANDYLELIGLQGINAGNAVTEDNFVVGTASTGSGGSYTNSTTVFPVSSSSGDLVSVWRNGIKLVPTTDFTVASNASTVTLQAAANASDEITVHVVGILQHSNFVQTTGGTFTGNVAYTGNIQVDDIVEKTSAHGVEIDGVLVKDGDVGLATISSKAGTSVGVTLGTDSGDDFNVGSGKLIVEGDTGQVGVGVADPISPVHINVNATDSIPTNQLIQQGDDNVLVLRNTNNSANYSGIKLEVRTTGASGWLIANEWKSQYSGDLVFRGRSSGNDSAERMRITGSGLVGIGTDSPSTARRLHIKNTDDTRGLVIENTLSSSYAEAHLKASREFRIGTGNSSSAVAARDKFYIYDATASAHRFTIDASGKVGIGETTPSANILTGKTTGSNSANIYLGATGTGNAEIVLDASNGDFIGSDYYILRQLNSLDVENWLGTSGDYIWKTAGGTERMRITSAGRVTMPSQPFASVYFQSLDAGAYNNAGNRYGIPSGIRVNQGSHYSTSNGRFTCPVDGDYECAFSGNYYTGGTSPGTWVMPKFFKNGSEVTRFYNSVTSYTDVWIMLTGYAIIRCSANDYIQLYNQTQSTAGGGWDVGLYNGVYFRLLG